MNPGNPPTRKNVTGYRLNLKNSTYVVRHFGIDWCVKERMRRDYLQDIRLVRPTLAYCTQYRYTVIFIIVIVIIIN